jgi:multisubunit Na+/H+ antiporter MnhE subunit
MGKYIFAVTTFTLIWILFTESLTWQNITVGLLVACGTLFFFAKFLPVKKITDVRFRKLILFPFYLVGQIYISGFYMIKMMLKGHEVDFVTIQTDIKSETLKTILGDAITLTPGSTLIEIIGDEMTLLWIRDKGTPPDPHLAEEKLKNKLEAFLRKAEAAPSKIPALKIPKVKQSKTELSEAELYKADLSKMEISANEGDESDD